MTNQESEVKPIVGMGTQLEVGGHVATVVGFTHDSVLVSIEALGPKVRPSVSFNDIEKQFPRWPSGKEIKCQ